MAELLSIPVHWKRSQSSMRFRSSQSRQILYRFFKLWVWWTWNHACKRIRTTLPYTCHSDFLNRKMSREMFSESRVCGLIAVSACEIGSKRLSIGVRSQCWNCYLVDAGREDAWKIKVSEWFSSINRISRECEWKVRKCGHGFESPLWSESSVRVSVDTILCDNNENCSKI